MELAGYAHEACSFDLLVKHVYSLSILIGIKQKQIILKQSYGSYGIQVQSGKFMIFGG